MKLRRAPALLLAISIAGLLSSAPALAGPVNVPGDFPGDFRMDLLVIDAFADYPLTGAGVGSLTLNPNELGIDFSASAFSGTGDPNWGTSTLTTTAQSFEIGRVKWLAKDVVLTIAAGGSGGLEDLGDGTGHWTLTLPVVLEYDGQAQLETDATLTTNGSYSYYDEFGSLQTVSGVAMDYATGNALLVGQVLVTDPASELVGYRATFAIQGNDPVAVPEPSTLAMLTIGLIGLVRLGRKR